ncbi:rCG47038, isoform CRA_d [Rattus norvegicus]|uniref:RCG47038, isoform CRA_d n=1 Tax=Rattus norvegicus TaxID=10116 RepID=A6KUJ9_RAT|nr:rCG47038, isoform CRA_d [Rattus norvegicus]
MKFKKFYDFGAIFEWSERLFSFFQCETRHWKSLAPRVTIDFFLHCSMSM